MGGRGVSMAHRGERRLEEREGEGVLGSVEQHHVIGTIVQYDKPSFLRVVVSISLVAALGSLLGRQCVVWAVLSRPG